MDKFRRTLRNLGKKLKELDKKLAEKDEKFDDIFTEEAKQQIFELENKIAASVDKLNGLIAEDGEKVLVYRRSADEEEQREKAKRNAVDLDD